MPFPGWLAAIVHVPVAIRLTALPVTEQIFGVVLLKVTGRPDVAVALSVTVPLPNGTFGENLTTSGLDVNGALIGERWRVGPEVIVEVSCPRIPCDTFRGWMERAGWIKRFTKAGLPGAYLRVTREGRICAGDPVEIVHRPGHEVSIALVFRALTTESDRLPDLLAAGDALPQETRDQIARRTA